MSAVWKRMTRPRFLFVYPLIIGLFVSAHITEWSLRIGVALIAAGLLVRLWANGYIGMLKVNWTSQELAVPKVGRLMTAGPYAFVRHPLYFGTLLLGAGFCVIVAQLWLSIVALAAFLIIYDRKMRQEERLLAAECGQEYAQYQAAVPRLLPRCTAYPAHHAERWTWAGVIASKEWKTMLWVIVLVIAMYFWEEYVQEREGLFEERMSYRMFLVGVLFTLMLLDGAVELMLRHRRRRRESPGSA